MIAFSETRHFRRTGNPYDIPGNPRAEESDGVDRPGAKASSVVASQLRSFTFDHRLDGIVAACRRDTRELTLIIVNDNRVHEQVLRAGDHSYDGYPPLPYEDEIDRWAERRGSRTR